MYMSIEQLYQVACLAFVGSMTKAAEELHMTQQNLSKVISSVEEEVGVVLFERSRYGTKLSKAGEKILPIVESMIKEYEKHMRYISTAIASLESPICLIHENETTVALLPDNIKGFPIGTEISASIATELNEGLVGVLQGKYDVCLTIRPKYLYDLEFVPVSSKKNYVVMSKNHRLANAEHIYLQDLREERFLMAAIPSNARAIFTNCRLACGFYPQIFAEYPTAREVLHAVAKNYGIMMTTNLIFSNNEEDNLARKPVDALPDIEYGIAVKPERCAETAIQTLINAVREYNAQRK